MTYGKIMQSYAACKQIKHNYQQDHTGQAANNNVNTKDK